MAIDEWAQFVGIAIGGAFGLVCLFDGTRRVAGREAGPRGARRALVGALLVGMLAVYSYWQHWTYVDVARSYLPDEQLVRELPADWGKKMSPARREAASRGVARGAFIESGKLGRYFDASGQRMVYAPAQEDLKRREAVLSAAARIGERARSSFGEFVLWLVLGLSAAVFGLCFALEPALKPKPADAGGEPPSA